MIRPDRSAILDRCKTDPVWYCRNVLGQDLTWYQEQILRSLQVNRHTRVRSAHGVGKTLTAGLAVAWYMPNHPLSIGITTAPTDRQVRAQLWGEIGKLVDGAVVKLSAKMPKTKAWHLGKKWYAIGFTAPPNEPTKFQGFHAPHVLVVADEADGISKRIYDEGISACMSNEDAHQLSIGNPCDPRSEFANSFKDPSPGAFKISAFDTPNFTEFGIGLEDIRSGEWIDKIGGRKLPRPYLVTPTWVADRYTKWGEGSPLWASRVMADFPDTSDDALASLSWVTYAADEFRSSAWPTERVTPHILGVDVARTGNDSTKIYERKGRHCRRLLEVHGADTMVVVGHVIQMQRQSGATQVNIDEIGIGAGVVDRLHEQGYLWAVGVNNGSRADDEERFKNVRAESYWGVREALERGGLYVQEEEFQTEITSIKWKPTSSGQIQIEAKEEVRRRLGRSPDDADAVALTYAKARRIVII